MLLPEAALNEPSLAGGLIKSGGSALCHTGAVRDRGAVCRTTSLTHGVREGGPHTSGRKRQEATQIAVCNLMGIGLPECQSGSPLVPG